MPILSRLALLVLTAGAMALFAAEDVRPLPSDIKKFTTDSGYVMYDYFKNFKVRRRDIQRILKEYVEIEEEHWRHGYSHVSGGERTGQIILKDGRQIKWFVKPGGLATLTYPSGKTIFLACGKTPWPLNQPSK